MFPSLTLADECEPLVNHRRFEFAGYVPLAIRRAVAITTWWPLEIFNCFNSKVRKFAFELSRVPSKSTAIIFLVIKSSEAAHENEPRLAVPSCHGRRWSG